MPTRAGPYPTPCFPCPHPIPPHATLQIRIYSLLASSLFPPHLCSLPVCTPALARCRANSTRLSLHNQHKQSPPSSLCPAMPCYNLPPLYPVLLPLPSLLSAVLRTLPSPAPASPLPPLPGTLCSQSSSPSPSPSAPPSPSPSASPCSSGDFPFSLLPLPSAFPLPPPACILPSALLRSAPLPYLPTPPLPCLVSPSSATSPHPLPHPLPCPFLRSPPQCFPHLRPLPSIYMPLPIYYVSSTTSHLRHPTPQPPSHTPHTPPDCIRPRLPTPPNCHIPPHPSPPVRPSCSRLSSASLLSLPFLLPHLSFPSVSTPISLLPERARPARADPHGPHPPRKWNESHLPARNSRVISKRKRAKATN